MHYWAWSFFNHKMARLTSHRTRICMVFGDYSKENKQLVCGRFIVPISLPSKKVAVLFALDGAWRINPRIVTSSGLGYSRYFTFFFHKLLRNTSAESRDVSLLELQELLGVVPSQQLQGFTQQTHQVSPSPWPPVDGVGWAHGPRNRGPGGPGWGPGGPGERCSSWRSWSSKKCRQPRWPMAVWSMPWRWRSGWESTGWERSYWWFKG